LGGPGYPHAALIYTFDAGVETGLPLAHTELYGKVVSPCPSLFLLLLDTNLATTPLVSFGRMRRGLLRSGSTGNTPGRSGGFRCDTCGIALGSSQGLSNHGRVCGGAPGTGTPNQEAGAREVRAQGSSGDGEGEARGSHVDAGGVHGHDGGPDGDGGSAEFGAGGLEEGETAVTGDDSDGGDAAEEHIARLEQRGTLDEARMLRTKRPDPHMTEVELAAVRFLQVRAEDGGGGACNLVSTYSTISMSLCYILTFPCYIHALSMSPYFYKMVTLW
jgi:hypothetical protein